MYVAQKYNRGKKNSIIFFTLLLLLFFSISFCSFADNNDEFITHEVTNGDTLWSLSKEYNTPLKLIVAINNVEDEDTLSIGQIIKIPQDNLPVADYTLHTVKKGETLWSIAQECNLSINQIIAANNLANSELISIGQQIEIPSIKNATPETNIITQPVIDKKNDIMNDNISQPENTESVWSITEKYKVSNNSIASDNNIGNSELISIGPEMKTSSHKNAVFETNISNQTVINKKNNKINNNISQPENAEPTIYTVEAGDNLWNISRKYGVSVAVITDINNLGDKDLLSPGQKIEIPAIVGVSNYNQKQEPTIVNYTIVKGDSLWSISRRYDISMNAIISSNNLKEITRLSIGQKLELPITNMDIAKAEGYNQDTAADQTNIIAQPVIEKKNNNIKQPETVEPIVYTVKAGDNLWNISRKYGVSVAVITDINHLGDKDLLSLGQKLEIPGVGGGIPDSNQKEEPTIIVYTIVKGDTLWGISQRYDVNMSTIISTNNLKEITRLSIGQKLELPITNMDIAKAEGYGQDTEAEEIIYYVKKGESLWSISHEYNVKLEAIIAANRITDASRISAGQALRIPNVPGTSSNRYSFIWPVRGRITSPYGMRVLNGRNDFHAGIDIGGAVGTNIVAAESGKVTYAGYMRGYGNVIILSHNGGYSTVYGHNSVNLVKKGQSIKKGSVIAKVGRTGNATGPHLHFEVRLSGKPVNPLLYLK